MSWKCELRVKTAQLLANFETPACRDRLIELLSDSQPMVQRTACESLTRQGSPAPATAFIDLLGDEDRFVAFAARRALEQLPVKQWADLVLDTTSSRTFCHGAVSLLAMTQDSTTAQGILSKCGNALFSVPSSNNNMSIVNLLRVMQLALIHGKLSPQAVPNLGQQLLAEYPSGNQNIDREMVRLLVYLDQPGAAAKFAQQIQAEIPMSEKLHLGAYAAQLNNGWEQDSKLVFTNFYEEARAVPGGYSVSA